MRFILILIVLAALTGCGMRLNSAPANERPVGTLIPTSATTPAPAAPVATAVAGTPAQPPAAPTSVPTQPPPATPESASTQPAAPTSVPTQPLPAPAQPEPPTASQMPQIALQQIVDGFDRPLHITHAGDGSGRLFVVEKVGRIRIVRNGQALPEPFLDITDRVGSRANEQGLLSVAFHPRYRENGWLFVNYTDNEGNTVVSRFSAEGDRADPSSEEVALTIEQPFANHNGGLIVFGPDGMLYVGMGDGGSAGDPLGAGQDRWTLLGKILRINVDTLPYTIPPDNPWADGSGGRQEVWILGVRNPWRFSFDRATGDLFVADVGQNRLEEVHMLPAGKSAGANLGWNIMEGNECFRGNDCDRRALDLPIDVYPHSLGCSVTGGHVYRGAAFPALQGIYVFGDFCSGRIWGLRPSAGGWERTELWQSNIQIAAFGEDEAGELYVAGYNNGVLYRIVVE
ncbi:sorbosone dehydrogenase family protein [Roseiflexus sp.]|uniref:PQQ-dependent sugar dehydrogenase n=1 Tax=Roseiflexus sp. TaxID=2562120 RepID=UPI0021DDDD49|nr:PQQ-dependent sugar dehydrogenase [Roseiflexus sp.]GIV99341.1 MAG: glucose dehydrogenase [Roseiflexus sp.]